MTDLFSLFLLGDIFAVRMRYNLVSLGCDMPRYSRCDIIQIPNAFDISRLWRGMQKHIERSISSCDSNISKIPVGIYIDA